MTPAPRFPIGTKFKTGGKHPLECTVVDIWTTTDSTGKVVRIRYVAAHDFLGQQVLDHDVVDTTIARGLIA